MKRILRGAALLMLVSAGLPAAADSPTAAADSPTAMADSPAANATSPTAAAPTTPIDLGLPSKYSLGVRVRGIFIPSSFLTPFLAASTSMNSVSLGLEFIYRKPTYDVVTSLDFSFLDAQDGNYLANGHSAGSDTHYAQFRNLNFLSADVSIIGHHRWESAPWFELRYGAGIGMGLVLGDVLLTNNWSQCTAKNASDLKQCHPIGVDLTSKDREKELQATAGPAASDTASTPHRHASPDKPPVMPVLNVLVGFKFRLQRHVSAQLEVGFRDAMFLGVGLHYWF